MDRKPPSPGNSGLKFRHGTERIDSKGCKPLPEPTTVKSVLLLVVQYVCRKLLFVNTFYRVIYYMAMIFLISVVVDFIPAPRLSIVRKESFFNRYFVKIGWLWTTFVLLPFITTTSFIYCCGKRNRIVMHLLRLGIATGFWFFWTKMFNYIESTYGRCNVRDERLQNKSACLGRGFFWQSVDISGHCFILIYSNLVMIEEARVINCWEGIADYIRDEDYERTTEEGYRTNPLRALDTEELNMLKNAFPKITPCVRGLFILVTLLSIIWEYMLLATVLFYHSMIEKFLAGLTAIFTWYLTYYIWYPSNKLPPNLPGDGCFKYMDSKCKEPVIKKRPPTTRTQVGPTFMGMPIRRPTEDRTTTNDSNQT